MAQNVYSFTKLTDTCCNRGMENEFPRLEYTQSSMSCFETSAFSLLGRTCYIQFYQESYTCKTILAETLFRINILQYKDSSTTILCAGSLIVLSKELQQHKDFIIMSIRYSVTYHLSAYVCECVHVYKLGLSENQ